MANEARINASLQIDVGNLHYASKPTAFTANVTGTNGPTPGTILVSTTGTDISLTGLTATGGFCRLINLDPTNFATLGVFVGGVFYPLLEIQAGESYVVRLSRTAPSGYTWRMKADTANVRVGVEAFDP